MKKHFYRGDKCSMKVFISWSGKISFEVAKVLKEWIPCVIQDIQPYFSSEDIDKGARWSTDIAKELETASFGILCVTKDNLESQWLNFEAGALSKAIDKAKVCPLLFHLKPSDISNSPILQFQMTNIEKEDIHKLFKSINSTLGDNGLEEIILEKVFNTFWPQIERDFNKINVTEIHNESENIKEDKNIEILEEMLDLLRSQQMLLKNPERILPIEYMQEVLYQLQADNNDMGNRIPVRAVADLMKSEGELKDALRIATVVDDMKYKRLKDTIINFVNNTNKIMKILGFDTSLDFGSF